MIYHDYREVAAPTVFPVTLDEVKDWLRIDDTASDAQLQGLIQAATILAEQMVNRPLITRSFTLTLDRFPAAICLDKVPCQSVTSITYLDDAGASQTLATSVYRVAIGGKWKQCEIRPDYGQTWPTTYPVDAAVTVTFTAGFGSIWNDIPQPIRSGILFLIAGAYDFRCSLETMQMHETPTAKALMDCEKWPRSM